MKREKPSEFSALTFFSTHSREEDGFSAARVLLQRDKANLEASTSELTQSVEELKVELGNYKTAYTNRLNEIKGLEGELEKAKAGFWKKLWWSISSEQEQKKP
ncbi:hypothetical protein [Pseudomonas caricapapayae]|uniref:hypothetical protein n=1 Tax=Pseudomonas caricapapayae TaxID=46678 RepID=UPI000F00A880|nr:hypothetical protein [Pseudomonas caricapapayae]